MFKRYASTIAVLVLLLAAAFSHAEEIRYRGLTEDIHIAVTVGQTPALQLTRVKIRKISETAFEIVLNKREACRLAQTIDPDDPDNTNPDQSPYSHEPTFASSNEQTGARNEHHEKKTAELSELLHTGSSIDVSAKLPPNVLLQAGRDPPHEHHHAFASSDANQHSYQDLPTVPSSSSKPARDARSPPKNRRNTGHVSLNVLLQASPLHQMHMHTQTSSHRPIKQTLAAATSMQRRLSACTFDAGLCSIWNQNTDDIFEHLDPEQ
jgi:hypothetical protein